MSTNRKLDRISAALVSIDAWNRRYIEKWEIRDGKMPWGTLLSPFKVLVEDPPPV